MTDIAAMAKSIPRLTAAEIQRVTDTAWAERPPFSAVLRHHGLSPGKLIQLLRRELTPSAFKVWTARTKAAPVRPARPARRAPLKPAR